MLASLLDADTIWIFVPMGGIVIALISILISHQQKMAQILHGKGAGVSSELESEVHALRHEVEELRGHVGRQALMLDGLKSSSSGANADVLQR